MRAAAAAGYQVIAADVFCDEDTRRNAFQAYSLGYEQGGFDPGDVRARLMPLLAEAGTGFAYGSGFESQPDLLEEIAQLCPVFGNTATTVSKVKDPQYFFSRLSALDIPHPEISSAPPHDMQGWLNKRIGGSGGTHITFSPVPHALRYFQRLLPGKPVSLLFLADGRHAVEVGYHEQWLAPALNMPYRYGGAVSQVQLPAAVRDGMQAAAQQLTAEFALRGLNSLDCMVAGNGWWVLEINPRLSASFALYDAATSGARLFEAHLEGCRGLIAMQFQPEKAQAHLIYYSDKDSIIPPDMQWPAWVADVPAAGVHIGSGEPLCSIMAVAETAGEAKMLAWQRADMLTQHILKTLPERSK